MISCASNGTASIKNDIQADGEFITPTIAIKSTPTPVPTTTCFDHVFHSDADDPGTPIKPNVPTAYTYKDVKSYLEKKPGRFHLFEKELHARPIMLAIEEGYHLNDDIKADISYDQIASYFFNSYSHYWEIFKGNPFPYFIMILQKGDDPELNYKFMEHRYCIPYINVHPQMNGLDVINQEMFEIWMGEGGSCMQGPEWFVVSSNVYYDNRYAPQKYIPFDAKLYMSYYVTMMQKSKYSGKSLDKIRGYGDTVDDHAYAEWNGYKVLYMLDEGLKKSGLSLDNLLHELYKKWGTNPKRVRFSDKDIQKILFNLTGDDFSSVFDKHVYSYSDFEERMYPYICHNGIIEKGMYYAALYDLKGHLFDKDYSANSVSTQPGEVAEMGKSTINWELINWNSPDLILNDPVNDSKNIKGMDFEKISIVIKENEGIYVKISGAQPFSHEQSEIDLILFNSKNEKYGFSVHPNNSFAAWDCDGCQVNSKQSQLFGEWSDEIFLFIPASSIDNDLKINRVWIALNYPPDKNKDEWITADKVE